MSKHNIYIRNGTYYARIQINGKEIRRSLQIADKRVAKQKLKAFLETAEKVKAGIDIPIIRTWEEAVVKWSETQIGDLRPSTQKRYKTSLVQLHPFFSGRNIELIKTADVHNYASTRISNGAKPATVRRDLTVISRVMNTARRADWITVNPVIDEMAEIHERREPITPVSIYLLARLVHRAPQGFKQLIRFLAQGVDRKKPLPSNGEI